MRRREFIVLLGGGVLGWPLAARAQSSRAVRKIGVLMPFAADDLEGKAELAAFAQQLQSLGWADGKNVHIDYRWADGDTQRMQALAKELIALQPDVLFVRSTPATAALAHNTRTIPIVFAVVSDPVGDGFVASLARPEGNVTGFTNAESSMTGKWLSLLKEITPASNRIAFIFDPKLAPGGGAYYTSLIQTASASLNITPVPLSIHNADDIDHAIEDFARNPSGGLIVLPDGTTNFHRELIIALAARYRLPAIYAFRNFPQEGGLMSYGVDITELFQRAASYVDRILKGARPADLPVQLPEKFEFVINKKTAKQLGIQVQPSLFAIADDVVE
jgi:putative tryptophan/tyrosine transport system substrate-binding protein